MHPKFVCRQSERIYIANREVDIRENVASSKRSDDNQLGFQATMY